MRRRSKQPPIHPSFPSRERERERELTQLVRQMKLVWCPETAGKAYIDAVSILSGNSDQIGGEAGAGGDTDAAELVAAMAGGWRAQWIVEAWSGCGGGFATSLALSAAAKRTGAKHVCVVPDARSREEYAAVMGSKGVEVLIAGQEEDDEAAAAAAVREGVDFMVVDCRRREFAARVLRAVKPGPRGAVVMCTGGSEVAGERGVFGSAGGGKWRGVFAPGTRVVRAAFLPLGEGGMDVVHIGVGKGPSLGDHRRWIKHVDPQTGEEHVFRR